MRTTYDVAWDGFAAAAVRPDQAGQAAGRPAGRYSWLDNIRLIMMWLNCQVFGRGTIL